uniref:Uncharacterized protein n=1 Tax=Physcomitrium patens TaxID=3218 RepID=A0A2K1JPN1_PHYPA|nr:hypothetical protein PHYPA_015881 [Physcomitrium patens]
MSISHEGNNFLAVVGSRFSIPWRHVLLENPSFHLVTAYCEDSKSSLEWFNVNVTYACNVNMQTSSEKKRGCPH